MRIRYIINLTKNHSIAFCGMKGSGKDTLCGNIIRRINKPYVSNCDYGGEHIPFDYKNFDLKCDYNAIINNIVPSYVYPYPVGTDLWLSDVGVIFPAQYCNELNKAYKSFPIWLALSRHFGAKCFFNVQNLNRCWDKLREHCDLYIYCNRCIHLGFLVIQSITIYDKAESCQSRVRPCRVSGLKLNPVANVQADIYRDNFFNTHGMVKRRLLIYLNKSEHDTHFYKKFFENGGNKNEKENNSNLFTFSFNG